MRAVWKGRTIARSDDTVVVEGNHYFPPESVDMSLLAFSNHRSRCAWKGEARYWSVLVDGDLLADAAWSYPEPSEAAQAIRGRIAFWKGVQVLE